MRRLRVRQEVWHNLQGPAPGSASQPPPPQEQRHQRGTKLVKCDMSLWGLQIQSIISPRQQAVGTQQAGRWEAGEQASVLGKGGVVLCPLPAVVQLERPFPRLSSFFTSLLAACFSGSINHPYPDNHQTGSPHQETCRLLFLFCLETVSPVA